jgi:hypothetical protein
MSATKPTNPTIVAAETLTQQVLDRVASSTAEEFSRQIFCAALVGCAVDRLTAATRENTAAIERNARAVMRAGDLNPDATNDGGLGEPEGVWP